MLTTVGHGVNTVFREFNFPELHIKIGIDSGVNAIIEYGSSSSVTKSHVDIIGYPMNLTAKITARQCQTRQWLVILLIKHWICNHVKC
jgi:class 3 adenylate cyclase